MNPQLTAAASTATEHGDSGGRAAPPRGPGGQPPVTSLLWLLGYPCPPAHALAPTFPSKSHGFEAPVQDCGPHSG